MIAELRRRADAEAQQAFRDANAYYFRHGRRSPALDLAYIACERHLDVIDEIIRQLQLDDPEAPDTIGSWMEAAASDSPWAVA